MNQITKFLAIILAIGIIITPFSTWAEDDTVDNVDTVANAESDGRVAVALTAAISTPVDNASIQTGVSTTFAAIAQGGEPPYAYTWDFGDNTTAFGQSYDKTYTATGMKAVTLKITDFAGHTASKTIDVEIKAPVTTLTATISTPADNITIQTGVATTFSAAAGGGEPPYAYTWDFGDSTTAFGQSYDKTYTTTGAKTVTLVITDFAARTATATIAVMVTAPPTPDDDDDDPTTEQLTISNIRVTDVTHNSAIVRWTTNRAASSRVIYDTVSHPSITGQVAPNFGYASSTATTDVDTKIIEHSVSVTSLLPSTTYYFRVISQ